MYIGPITGSFHLIQETWQENYLFKGLYLQLEVPQHLFHAGAGPEYCALLYLVTEGVNSGAPLNIPVHPLRIINLILLPTVTKPGFHIISSA